MRIIVAHESKFCPSPPAGRSSSDRCENYAFKCDASPPRASKRTNVRVRCAHW